MNIWKHGTLHILYPYPSCMSDFVAQHVSLTISEQLLLM